MINGYGWVELKDRKLNWKDKIESYNCRAECLKFGLWVLKMLVITEYGFICENEQPKQSEAFDYWKDRGQKTE